MSFIRCGCIEYMPFTRATRGFGALAFARINWEWLALAWYVQGLEQRGELEIKLTIPEESGDSRARWSLWCSGLVQECLTNIHRRSGSKSAQIRVSRGAESVLVEVDDQGHVPGALGRGSIAGVGGGHQRHSRAYAPIPWRSGTRISVPVCAITLARNE
jgi:hypothetical protein